MDEPNSYEEFINSEHVAELLNKDPLEFINWTAFIIRGAASSIAAYSELLAAYAELEDVSIVIKMPGHPEQSMPLKFFVEIFKKNGREIHNYGSLQGHYVHNGRFKQD